MSPRLAAGRQAGDTKLRILDAAEDLFIEYGYEAMSLRQITSRAEVNLAAVNYHFGSKETLLQAMLARRLDRLNDERLALLTRAEAEWPDGQLTCEHVLGAMFIPALAISHHREIGGPAFLRLLGRVYADPSPFIREYLQQHYAPVFERFFEAFARALPELPRQELGWRLHFALQALSGVLASSDTSRLIDTFAQGQPMGDLQVVARLTALMVAALKAPMPGEAQLASFAAVFALARDADVTPPREAGAAPGADHGAASGDGNAPPDTSAAMPGGHGRSLASA
ncbi:TetR family transcriptional regulator [Pandoraea pnomenusa]|uniref:TetR family transcriptional regulator n=1 Tax=Pandoraea pnomenusa TaxID=93220 RepID=A0ABY6WID4_9BURK|nr:TetR family transcriptional regulator [Pandoraea pnomenusa]VVE62211.1 TetR family transcriptional regulator [Pandoraea pnomenusa]